jgi:hypothetical protein
MPLLPKLRQLGLAVRVFEAGFARAPERAGYSSSAGGTRLDASL